MNKIAILKSAREHEYRLPIHPTHFIHLIDNKASIIFEEGYQLGCKSNKNKLTSFGFETDKRTVLLEQSDVIFVLKPTIDDIKKMKKGATLVGWCHAVQQFDLTTAAVQNDLTLIALESMYEPGVEKYGSAHLFSENNTITGEIGVFHALSCVSNKSLHFKKAAVIGYGNVGVAATKKFLDLNFDMIVVFTKRDVSNVNDRYEKVSYQKISYYSDRLEVEGHGSLSEHLKSFDVVVNCVKQDPTNSDLFFSIDDLKSNNNKLFIDFSCDKEMGFEFSHETSWEQPVEDLYNNFYYSISNVPSLVWDRASLKISEVLYDIVNAYAANNFSEWLRIVIDDATEIKKGRIKNLKIKEYHDAYLLPKIVI